MYAPVVTSKTISDPRPKWANLRPERPQNPTLWEGAYLYGIYKGAPRVLTNIFVRLIIQRTGRHTSTKNF